MKCKKCGNEMPEGSKFCGVCGEPVSGSSQNFGGQPPRAPQPPRPSYSQQDYGRNYSGNYGRGGNYRAPITARSIPMAIILSIVTCGIYGIYWLYCLVNDLNTASGHENDTSGGMVILFSIISCGIYSIYWYYTAGGKVGEIQEYDGRPRDSYLGVLYLVLNLVGFSIINMALIQNELNKVAGL